MTGLKALPIGGSATPAPGFGAPAKLLIGPPMFIAAAGIAIILCAGELLATVILFDGGVDGM